MSFYLFLFDKKKFNLKQKVNKTKTPTLKKNEMIAVVNKINKIKSLKCSKNI